MYVPSVRRPLGQAIVPTVNPTPWVAGALLLVAAVFLPKMLRRMERR
jgi:hypothetical protein